MHLLWTRARRLMPRIACRPTHGRGPRRRLGPEAAETISFSCAAPHHVCLHSIYRRSLVQRAQAGRLPPVVCRTQWRPTTVCKVRSSSSDQLFLLALLPMARPSTSRRVGHVRTCHLHATLQLCHASPHAVTRGVQPHSSPCVGQLKPERPSSATGMPLSV